MADDKTKSPSADEKVDSDAAELGVDAEEAPETSADAPAETDGAADAAAPSEKKKKKKAEAAADSDDEPAEDDEKPAAAKSSSDKAKADKPKTEKAKADKAKAGKPKTEKAKADKAAAPLVGMEGLFKPETADVDIETLTAGTEYLNDDDLGGYEAKPMNPLVPVVIGLVIVVLGVIGGVLYKTTNVLDDLVHLFQGDLQEYRLAEKARVEEEHRKAQLEALERFGNLQIVGNSLYALVKLNGEVQYGQTSSGQWRELRVGPSTVFQNLKIKEDQQVELSSPGFQPQSFTLTEGMWQPSPAGVDYAYTLSVNLLPESEKHHHEINARMESDIENDYFGAVSIVTIPAGAKVTFNNHPLLDKDGNELVTPVTFDRNWVRDEASGKLEEQLVRVDTPPDNGHKIELEFPGQEDMPRYVTGLQRRMWECEFKSEDEIKKLGAAADNVQNHCNYKWSLEMDFNGLKRYIAAREAEEKRIREQQEQAEQLQAEGKDEKDGEQG